MGNKKFKMVVSVFFVIVILIICPVDGAETNEYRLNLEKDKAYYIRIMIDKQTVIRPSSTQSAGKKEFAEQQNFGFGYNVDVDEVDGEGNAWIKLEYDWVSLLQKSPQGEVRYNSSKTYRVLPKSARGFAALVGQRFFVKMTPQGRIEKINGLGLLRSHVKSRLPGSATEEQKDAMLKGMDSQLEQMATKEFFETLMAIYPEVAVGVGDSWSEKTSSIGGLPVVAERKFELKERKGGVAVIGVNSVIESDPEAKPLRTGTLEVTYKLSGKQEGQIKMEESTGRVIYSKLTEEISGKTETRVMDGSGWRNISPIKIQGTTTFEMTERKKEQAY